MSSNISQEAKYGCVTGRFHSLRRNILNRDSFVNSMAGLLHYLLLKEYDISRMLQDTRRLCLQFPELFGAPPHATFEQIRTTGPRSAMLMLIFWCYLASGIILFSPHFWGVLLVSQFFLSGMLHGIFILLA